MSLNPLGLSGLKYILRRVFVAGVGLNPLGLSGLKSFGRTWISKHFGLNPLGLSGLKYFTPFLFLFVDMSQPSWVEWIEISENE